MPKKSNDMLPDICLRLVWEMPEIRFWYCWDKMAALWAKERTIFNSYDTLSISIPKWTTFVKQVFDSMKSLESHKWLLCDEITA